MWSLTMGCLCDRQCTHWIWLSVTPKPDFSISGVRCTIRVNSNAVEALYTVVRPVFSEWWVTAVFSRFGRVEACKVLINLGRCSPNAVTDVDCWTPLHHAALNGQRYVIEFLLSLDNIDVVCRTWLKSNSLLHLFAAHTLIHFGMWDVMIISG